MKKGVSDPFNFKGRQIGISFTNPLGEPWSKYDDYLPEDIRNGDLGVYTFETVSQSRVLGNDEGKWHGKDVITYSNGEKWVGEFKYGKFNGQGTTHLF